MTDVRRRLEPGPDHPITIEPAPGRVVVRHGSSVIATTDEALALHEASHPPVLYVPIDDVDEARLRRSDHHTYCPYKGEASYYDVVGGDAAALPAAVWTYEDPYPAVGEIGGYVAFYTDRVEVETVPSPAG